MKWSDRYATGIARIDEQHKMIFQFAGDFREALDEGRGESVYGALLKSLGLYIRTHFGFEEQCMEQFRCPVAALNKEAHAQFAESFAAFEARYATGGFDQADARALVDTIDTWLSGHICKIDVGLKDRANARQT
jgi:hemerythrin-like metal-binding protein